MFKSWPTGYEVLLFCLSLDHKLKAQGPDVARHII